MRVSVSQVPSGDAGTFATLATMTRLAKAASIAPQVRYTAAAVASDAAVRDGTRQAIAFRQWIEDHTVFLRDPSGVELVHDPRVVVRAILTKGVAHIDCDDVATLAAALGLAVGLKARFAVVAFGSPQAPFRHVWTELADPRQQRWVEQDVTRPAQGLDGMAIGRIHYHRL